jgi:hypothetical protein
LSGVSNVVSDGSRLNSTPGFCGLLTSGGVDCWGAGPDGELGDGIFYTTGNAASPTPVSVFAP